MEEGADDEVRHNPPDGESDSPPRQRQRRFVVREELQPHSEAMAMSNEIFTFRDHCKLSDIHESQVNARVRTGKRYMDFQLLRMIVMSPNKQTNIFSRGPARRGSTESPKSGRMFLCRVYDYRNDAASGELVYFMQGEENKQLFLRENKLRDNGVLTIGTYFRVLAPAFISQYMNNELPMIVTTKPAIIMKRPPTIPSVEIKSLSVNQSRAFVLNGAELFVRDLDAVNAVCHGNLCDKQRLNKIRVGKCGCYTFSNISKCGVVFNHDLIVTPDGSIPGQPEIVATHFTSQRFSQFYITRPLTNSLTLSQIQDTVIMDEIETKLINLANYVNDNGGWTVIGWYRLGMVVDKALAVDTQANSTYGNNTEENNQVEAGETKFHIVSLYPTRPSFATRNSEDFQYMVNNKYRTEEIAL